MKKSIALIFVFLLIAVFLTVGCGKEKTGEVPSSPKTPEETDPIGPNGEDEPEVPHVHSYTVQNPAPQYLKEPAGCTHGNLYYYVCECGAVGYETSYESGGPVHQPTFVPAAAPGCTEDGNEAYYRCSSCGCLFADLAGTTPIAAVPTVPKTGHAFAEGWTSDNGYHWHASTCGHTDEVSGKAAHTPGTDGRCTVCDYLTEGPVTGTNLSAATLRRGVDGIYSATVANKVTTFDCAAEFLYSRRATVYYYKNISMTELWPSPAISLTEGDNVFYIGVLNDGRMALYTVKIRRAVLCHVKIVTGTGTGDSDFWVDEGTVLTAPKVSRVGYDFLGWDYDFTKPIEADAVITGSWSPKTDIPYKVEHYLQKNGSEYTLKETVNLTGTTDNTVFAVFKVYDYYAPKQSSYSGKVAGDGSTVIKVYYDLTPVSFSTSSTTPGSVTARFDPDQLRFYRDTLGRKNVNLTLDYYMLSTDYAEKINVTLTVSVGASAQEETYALLGEWTGNFGGGGEEYEYSAPLMFTVSIDGILASTSGTVTVSWTYGAQGTLSLQSVT